MSKPTVKRRDIELYEEPHEVEMPYTDPYPKPTENVWVAGLRGRLSTGPHVELSRQADHAGEALLLLEEAIRAQGWEIEE